MDWQWLVHIVLGFITWLVHILAGFITAYQPVILAYMPAILLGMMMACVALVSKCGLVGTMYWQSTDTVGYVWCILARVYTVIT